MKAVVFKKGQEEKARQIAARLRKECSSVSLVSAGYESIISSSFDIVRVEGEPEVKESADAPPPDPKPPVKRKAPVKSVDGAE